MSGAVAALQAQRDLRLGRVGGELVGLDRLGPELGELGPGERDPGRLDDPAPVGVAPVKRGLDQGRVGDRPRRALGLIDVRGPGYLDPADPRRPLAVGDDVERELQQDRVEQPRRQRPPAAPLA